MTKKKMIIIISDLNSHNSLLKDSKLCPQVVPHDNK